MAVYLETRKSEDLLRRFTILCASNKIETWEVSSYGKLRFTGSDLGANAYLEPVALPDKLARYVSFFDRKQNKRETYGVIQGRVIEMFTAHCADMFSAGRFTPQPEGKDEALDE